MKHYYSLFIIALLSMAAVKVQAYDAEIDGVYYNFNGDEAEVTYGTNEYGTRKNYYGEIVIPASVNHNGKSYNVTAVGEKAFAYAGSEKEGFSVTLPNTIVTIKKDAFQGSRMISLTIPSSVRTIEKGVMTFWNPVNDDKGNRINAIPKIIIKDLSAWMRIKFESELFRVDESFAKRGWDLYTDDGKKIADLVVPEDIDSIRAYTFAGCGSITSVTMRDNIKSIGDYAFWKCQSLTSVVIGDGVTAIGESAFSLRFDHGYEECGIKSLTFGKNVKNIGKCAFAYNKLTSLKLPENLETIADDAFAYSGKYRSLVIPNKVRTIGFAAFSTKGDTIQSLTIGSDVVSISSSSFSPDPIKVIWMTNTPPKNYDYIGAKEHYVSNNLYNRITMNIYPLLSSMFAVDGVKYVPTSMAERTCEAIDAVYDESAKLTKLGTTVTYRGVKFTVNNVRPYTCCGNTFIENVELTDLANIEDHVFDGCKNLQSVKLPETVSFLGKSSFQNCSLLREIVIPAATTEIKNNAFRGCASLQNVTMNDGSSVLNLSYNFNNFNVDVPISGTVCKPLFEDCPLDKVYIGRNISYSTKEKEGYSPFYRNTSLREVEITDRETEISENEFYGCTGMKSVKIGDGVTIFDSRAFSGCSSLDYFEFGSNVKTIGEEAFSDCSTVTNIISHTATPPVCGSQAMDDINKWDCTLTVPNGSTAAYQAADQWKEFLFTQDYDAYKAGVSDITADVDKAAPVYSLSGLRLAAPRKGINIIGGKKVVMK